MRILLFSYEYPPIGGGVANAVFSLLKEISQSHPTITIDCITASSTNNWERVQIAQNITLYMVPVGKNISNKSSTQVSGILKTQSPGNMLAFIALATLQGIALWWKRGYKQYDGRRYDSGRHDGGQHECKKFDGGQFNCHQYDLSLAFGYPGPFPSFFLRFFGIPYVVALRGVDVPGYNKKFGWWYKLYTPLVRLTWHRANAVIANSFVLHRLAQKIYPGKIHVIPNGVDTTAFAPVLIKDKNVTFTVTAGGTLLNPKKRIALLVRAYAEFVRQLGLSSSQSELMLVGDGPERARLENLAEQIGIRTHVRFVGQQSSKWLQNNLPRCHVFCLLSQAESNSNAVLEAAACGLPLVLAQGIGNVEFMQKESALLVTGNSDDELQIVATKKLIRLYTDNGLRRKLATQARAYAKEYSWKQVHQEMIEVLHNSRG